MSRLHPFDVLSAALPPGWFAEVQAAEAQEGGAADRLRFHNLHAVQRVLREWHPPGAELPGTTLAEYETLWYAAYRFWSAGRHTLAIERAALERALEADRGLSNRPTVEPSNRPAAVPRGACYLRLPERLFWARINQAAVPEPLDGMFVVSAAGGQEVTVLAVLGLRSDRGGFSQIVISAPPADLVRAGEVVRRPLFAPVLEGGERAGVKSLVSEAELLYLTHLALREIAR